jgi:phosphomannomutase
MGARRLFGTSGIRGVVNQGLSPDLCRRVGSAIGILPTPALALLTRELGFAFGVMVTASHNLPEFNGIKLFIENSLGYSQAQEAEIEKVFWEKQFRRRKRGSLEQARDMKQRYLAFIKNKLSRSGFNHHLKVVVDPGNGAASGFASDIFYQMGLDVIPVNDDPDGLFPGRSPETEKDTLQGTVAFLRKHNADLAVCFDGDADRVVFCDKQGFLGPNEPIAFISRLAIKKTTRKKIAPTVETGTLLDLAVKDLGGEVVRGRVGFEKTKVGCPNELKESVMARARDKSHIFSPVEINDLDGLRLEFPDFWMLIRASGTEPVIRVISESTSQIQTNELINKGKALVQSLVEASK